MQDQVLAQIAGIVFAISGDRPGQSIRFGESYRDFLGGDEPEVILHARYGQLPPFPLCDRDRVFDSQMVWSLYRVDGQHVFVLRAPSSGSQPYRIAAFRSDFSRGEVYIRASQSDGGPGALLPNPLDFPLSEVLMVCLLARGRGLMIHACGVDDGGRGYLFAGNSTHGKSTMARLWRDRATVLNDDRIVLRHRDGCFRMYGTPWHGDYTGVSPGGVPLDRVFFLRHAGTHQDTRRQGAAAASMLLARSFPPLWDPEGMGFTLDFGERLVAAVPCYELGFVPNESVVEFVRCV